MTALWQRTWYIMSRINSSSTNLHAFLNNPLSQTNKVNDNLEYKGLFDQDKCQIKNRNLESSISNLNTDPSNKHQYIQNI